ncbi:MAG: hypothetical protein LKJ50_03210 [Clostridiales bacterium]|jgi:hypothetical protein|nr:hypothetical protein [Clostridiales bacterium]MCI1960951.1 hypothetical protein [Clostridiales bacterium]MCI2021392.1 hypothetical protein [Clostridiales bacterium]MCI2026178.1 hypothetical protein [Clostridiales bacterium]
MTDTERLDKLKESLLSFVVRVTDEKRIAAPEEIAVLPEVAEVLGNLLIANAHTETVERAFMPMDSSTEKFSQKDCPEAISTAHPKAIRRPF